MNGLYRVYRHLLSGAILLWLSGCASIIDGGPKQVTVRSQPSGVMVTVFDMKGERILVQQTPAVLSLKRGGNYSAASYRIRVDLEGYRPAEAELKSTVNSWYFGNLLFGGLIGFLVDPLTGAMWTLSPRTVDISLITKVAGSVTPVSDGLFVVLRGKVGDDSVATFQPVDTTR